MASLKIVLVDGHKHWYVKVHLSMLNVSSGAWSEVKLS